LLSCFVIVFVLSGVHQAIIYEFRKRATCAFYARHFKM
jgi:hypothetical protein